MLSFQMESMILYIFLNRPEGMKEMGTRIFCVEEDFIETCLQFFSNKNFYARRE